MLLPPDIRNIIPYDHICYIINDIVNNLDISLVEKTYFNGTNLGGASAFSPRMLIKVKTYGFQLGLAYIENTLIKALVCSSLSRFKCVNPNDKENDEFICPVGKRLKLKITNRDPNDKTKIVSKRYFCADCVNCKSKTFCTNAKKQANLRRLGIGKFKNKNAGKAKHKDRKTKISGTDV